MKVQPKPAAKHASPPHMGTGWVNRLARRCRKNRSTVIPSPQSHNRPSSLSVNGTLILNQVAYSPFGPPTSWSWGNGSQTVRLYDSDGQLTSIDSAGQQQTYTYHPDGTIASWRNDAANFGLETADTTLTPASTSNRLSATCGELTRTYTHDAAGHITSDGNATYTYDAAGHLSSATRGGRTTTYSYNALGQRIKKASANANIGTTHFVYDHAGHLLGEYDQAGGLIQELVWLGDIPVATLRPGAGGSGGAGGAGAVAVYYIHTDHLDAPVKLTRPADGRVVWRWDHDPYGNGTPNEDPDGDGVSLRLNLRFAGQYADAETGLYYNMARYYDPLTGRYTQSDPIGLAGGLNTYGYVGGNPLSYVDPTGQFFAIPALVPLMPLIPIACYYSPGCKNLFEPVFSRPKNPSDVGPNQSPVSTLPSSSRDIWWPDKKSGQWSCKARADCNDNIPGNCPDESSKRFSFGGGTANDVGIARNIAKANATSNLQCQPKHVSCKCTGPKGEQYSGGC